MRSTRSAGSRGFRPTANGWRILNNLVHPEVRARTEELIAEYQASDPEAIVWWRLLSTSRPEAINGSIR